MVKSGNSIQLANSVFISDRRLCDVALPRANLRHPPRSVERVLEYSVIHSVFDCRGPLGGIRTFFGDLHLACSGASLTT